MVALLVEHNRRVKRMFLRHDLRQLWRLCRGIVARQTFSLDRQDEGPEPTSKQHVALSFVTLELTMGRGLLLWLIGIPLPIILLIWAFGGLH
jgi:hypothetical protein